MLIKKTLFLGLVSLIFVVTAVAHAQILPEKAREAVAGGYVSFDPSAAERSLSLMLAQLVQTSLGFVGIICTVMLVYAGFRYMTSGGDAEVIKSAKQTIKNTIFGIVLVVISYSITIFVLGRIVNAMVVDQMNRGGNPCLNGNLGKKGFWPPNSSSFKNACNKALGQ